MKTHEDLAATLLFCISHMCDENDSTKKELLERHLNAKEYLPIIRIASGLGLISRFPKLVKQESLTCLATLLVAHPIIALHFEDIYQTELFNLATTWPDTSLYRHVLLLNVDQQLSLLDALVALKNHKELGQKPGIGLLDTIIKKISINKRI
ncbi:MAG: hypothetical protein U0670_23940 [Anaerolineae bacterium]